MAGQAVRPWLHGYGRVVQGGAFPLVRFLHGGLPRVQAADLRVLEESEFREAVLNLALVEVWLSYRLMGRNAAYEASRLALLDLAEWAFPDELVVSAGDDWPQWPSSGDRGRPSL